jgi:hypothetical protein
MVVAGPVTREDAYKAAVREGFSRWAKARGCTRSKLTAHRRAAVGIQVVALDKSGYAADYYLRYGVALEPAAGFVQEPECDIRIPVEGAQPAIREEDPPTADEVVALLERYAEPLMARTATREALEGLRADGGLRQAAILRGVRATLGWGDD